LNEPAMEEAAVAESDLECEQAAQREENIETLQEHAAGFGISLHVHLDQGDPAEELAKESSYADLLVMSPDTFSNAEEAIPSEFVRSILHDAACPVVLAPEGFEQIDNIVFCCDGSKSSIYAIRQFSYLFPQLHSQRVKVIGLHAGTPAPQEQSRLTEWLRSQYADVEWIGQGPDAAEALFHYLLAKSNDFVVMGPYGHGLLASFFEPDYESGCIRSNSVPVFITHC
ncbi:MAG TPA: universal stress protein, partial [Puia sp.]|nr:universal stress protein [Puia sp.]